MGAGSAFGSVFPILMFAAVAVGVLYLTGLADRRRHERNRLFAASRGWDYLADDPSLVDQFAASPFGVGRSRNATDVMRGVVRGRAFLLFGYQYVTGSGKNRSVHNVIACTVGVPGAIPSVRITPENPGSRLFGALGGGDVDVESEEFNRRWHVWADDERIAHALLTPTMIDRFLEPDLNWKSVTFEPGRVVMCAAGKLDLPATPPPFEILCDVAELVPAFLGEDFSEN